MIISGGEYIYRFPPIDGLPVGTVMQGEFEYIVSYGHPLGGPRFRRRHAGVMTIDGNTWNIGYLDKFEPTEEIVR